MNRPALAAITAAVAGAIALAIVWTITLLIGSSFTNALTKPAFWVAEGATIALTALAVLAPADDLEPDSSSAIARIATHTALTAAGAVLIGLLLAIATDTPIIEVLTSFKFLIPAAIAISVAALEAWPDDTETSD